MPLPTHTEASPPRWWRSPWLRPFNDIEAIDGLVQRVLPRAALTAIRARVERVIDETRDTRSFVLHANRNWRGFRAGQHVLLTLEVRGRRLQRCFSISSMPGNDRHLTITVKRQSAQGVTAWMHAHLEPGAIVALSPPFGDFCIPAPAPQRLLLLSAGSGITPMMSILRQLAALPERGDVVLLHTCRHPGDWIFAEALQKMAGEWPSLWLIVHYSDRDGRLDAASLAAQVPDFFTRESLLCGPPAFADWVRATYAAHSAEHRLRSEHFGLHGRSQPVGETADHAIDCTKSEQSFTASTGQALLPAAEAAGLSPRHGCRIGICRSCLCKKSQGTVENLLTGEISAEPGTWIQLCISTARSPLTLEL